VRFYEFGWYRGFISSPHYWGELCCFRLKFYLFRKGAGRMSNVILPQIKNDLPENNITLADDGIYSDCVCRANLSGQTAQRATFRNMAFKNARFNGASLCGADIGDIRFENCDLSNLDLNGAMIYRAVFTGCRITGVDLSSSRLRNIVFENCGGKYANFRFAHIENAVFKNCSMQGTEFQSAAIIKTVFNGDDLRQAQMSGVPLSGIDLSSCEIDGLGTRPEDLRGAIISPEQAVTAAKIIGMTIKQ
jgi:uncharacterized protein YjbI with pentapeptide repeats